jgi:4-hydroxy-tetrahydrodipicolinate synthase
MMASGLPGTVTVKALLGAGPVRETARPAGREAADGLREAYDGLREAYEELTQSKT